MRFIYSTLLYLLWPLVLMAMLQQMKKRAGGVRYLTQRMGFSAPQSSNSVDVLLHAASVGEVNSLFPLLLVLVKEKKLRLAVSVNTPEAMRSLESFLVEHGLSSQIRAVYCPVDFYWATRRFLQRLAPSTVFVVEAEVWPNLYAVCRSRGVSVHVLNGHFKRSVESLSPVVKWFYREALRPVRSVAARSQVDLSRYAALGVDEAVISVLGNLKFCRAGSPLSSPPEIVSSRTYALFVSSREEEEGIVWQQWRKIAQPPLLVIAPRHMSRIQSIHDQLTAAGANVALLSRSLSLDTALDVLIVDSMGRIDEFLAGAAFGLLGGTFVNVGGHNILQIALADRYVLVGPYTKNIEQELQWLKDAGVATQIKIADELVAAIDRLETVPNDSFEGLRAKSNEILDGYSAWALSAIKAVVEK